MECLNCGTYCTGKSIYCLPPMDVNLSEAEKRVAAVKWCDHADEDGFNCKYIGVEETCKRGDKSCLIDDERYEP